MYGPPSRHRVLAASTAISLAIITLITACSGALGEAAFLTKSDTGLLYVRWTNANGQLAGTVIRFDASDFAQGGGTSKTFDFTGLTSGSSVTLNFRARSPEPAWTGRLSGDKLILSIPDQSGRLATAELDHADDSAYNAAVAVFAERAKLNVPVMEAAQTLGAAIEALMNTGSFEDLMRSAPKTMDPVVMQQTLDRLEWVYSQLQQAIAHGSSDAHKWFSEIGETYVAFFCQPDYSPVPTGSFGPTRDEAVWTIAAAVQRVVAAADNLDRFVAENPGASPPSPTSATGRDVASSAQSDLNSAVAAWDGEVANLKRILADARSVYESAFALAKEHRIAPGSSLSSCIPW